MPRCPARRKAEKKSGEMTLNSLSKRRSNGKTSTFTGILGSTSSQEIVANPKGVSHNSVVEVEQSIIFFSGDDGSKIISDEKQNRCK